MRPNPMAADFREEECPKLDIFLTCWGWERGHQGRAMRRETGEGKHHQKN